MNNNIYLYGPFHDCIGEKKIAIGSDKSREKFLNKVETYNPDLPTVNSVNLRDLKISSTNPFYVETKGNSNSLENSKIGSLMFRNCKDLFLVLKGVENYKYCKNDQELLGIISGDNKDHAKYFFNKYLRDNNQHNLVDNFTSIPLGTKINFGGLVALFK